MSYTIVTSFNKEGYGLYAQEMLKTFKKYWDKDIILEAWYHDCEIHAQFSTKRFHMPIPKEKH